MAAVGMVDSTGTMMLLLVRTDMVEATDALKKEMEVDAVGLLVDTVVVVVAVEATTMESLVTLNVHVGTMTARVEQFTGKQAS